jgi:hypothetical protein
MTKAELERQGRPYFEGVPKLIAQAPSEYPHPATRLSYRHMPIYGTIRQPSTPLCGGLPITAFLTPYLLCLCCADKGVGEDAEVNALVAEIIDMLNRGERIYLHCRYTGKFFWKLPSGPSP